MQSQSKTTKKNTKKSFQFGYRGYLHLNHTQINPTKISDLEKKKFNSVGIDNFFF